jgi:phosphoadenosine phosphosulfate reductase
MSAIELYQRPSAEFADKVQASVSLLQQLSQVHGRITQASSLGAEDMVLTHLVHLSGIRAGVFVLDTGHLHAETLALIPAITERYGVAVDIYHPDAQRAQALVGEHGAGLMFESVALRKACCAVRKLEPLSRALQGVDVWLTGLRREQSPERQDASSIETDGPRLKASPLIDWTWGDVWHFIAQHQLAYNPLHDAFYPSIGCAPCTRAISVGEPFRAGRWWWEDESAKECGLHVKP